jgi:hypothetical protein
VWSLIGEWRFGLHIPTTLLARADDVSNEGVMSVLGTKLPTEECRFEVRFQTLIGPAVDPTEMS